MGFPVNGGYHASRTGASHASHRPVYPPHPGVRHPPPTARPDRLAVPRRPLADRRTCTPATVWSLLLAAARAALAGGPSGQAVWNARRVALPKRRRTLERRLLAALHAPVGKPRRAVRLAIDYHRVGSFGRPNRDTTRSKPAGGERELLAAVVARLLDQVTGSGVAVRDVLLDKAFFAIAVMRLLQARRVPFVIRGRKPRPG